MHGTSPKSLAFTWQVNPNQPANLLLPGFCFAPSRLCCSHPIAGFRFKPVWKTTVLSRLSAGDSRVEVLASRPRGEAMLRVYLSRRPRVRRKGLKWGRRNGIIPS